MCRNLFIFIVLWLASGFCNVSVASTADSILVAFGPKSEPATIKVTVRTQCRHWALLWDYVDSTDYCIADVKRESPDYENELYKYSSNITISRIHDGVCNKLCITNVTHSSPCAGIRLSRNPEGQFSIVAGDETLIVCPNDSTVPFNAVPDSQVRFRSLDKCKEIYADLTLIERIPKISAPFDNFESLTAYLSQSSDSIEGIWLYMDRNIPLGKVQLGGNYVLATVRDKTQKDIYNIYYVSGADKYPELWMPLQLKGRLKATVFANNFDLSWTDALRATEYKQEAYATIENGHALLSVFIPLIKSQLRFRRMPLRPLE